MKAIWKGASAVILVVAGFFVWLNLTGNHVLVASQEVPPGSAYVGPDGKRAVRDTISLRCTFTNGAKFTRRISGRRRTRSTASDIAP